MQLGIISEVMSDGRICMLPSAFAPIRNLILANIDGHTTTPFNDEKVTGTFQMKFSEQNGEMQMVKDYVADPELLNYYGLLKPEDRVVNMVCLCGPMTRNGGACSYGTKMLRDKIMRAADYPQCKGHIIYCDTPGGMASCLPDMRMAINYAHDHGQSVYMLVDGVCASGGAFTSAICDKTFYVNAEDEIGSLGMYASLFTLKDGAVNTITSETYHEYYASASTNKNDFARAAADGDMSLVAERIETSLAELLANIKQDRPSITDEQLTGKMYKMAEVEGTLVDGQSDIKGVAQMLMTEWDERQGAPLPRKECATCQQHAEAPAPSASPEGDAECKPKEDTECKPKDDTECKPKDDTECKPKEGCEDDPEEAPVPSDSHDGEPEGEPEAEPQDPESDPEPAEEPEVTAEAPEAQTTNNDMKQYTAIPAAIGEGVMESVDGSLNLQEYQAEALENLLASGQNREAELQSQVESLTAQLAEAQQSAADQLAQQTAANEQLQSQLTEVQQSVEQLNADIEAGRQALADAEQAHANAMAELQAAHTAENEQHASETASLNEQLSTLQQQNTDLQATVDDLNQAQGHQPEAGEAPVNNGAQVKNVATVVATTSSFDPRLSAKENAERWNKARLAERNRR